MTRKRNPGARAGAAGAYWSGIESVRVKNTCFHGRLQGRNDARAITLALGGRWHATFGVSACPICQPERREGQTALTISDGADGRLLLHCKRSGCGFTDLLAAVGLRAGGYQPPSPETVAQREREARAAAARRSALAQRCWDEAKPIEGTPAEAYLRSRGITCTLPPTLRFHARCWHGETARRIPAMVALVQGASGFGIHRTYLQTDGSGKAGIEPAKSMLGATAGGGVRLARGGWPLVVCEGVETGLSLASGLLDRPASIVAALSASGMKSLRLPQSPSELIVATDGDAVGRSAGFCLAERAHALGWRVSMMHAADDQDWNDILTAKGMQK